MSQMKNEGEAHRQRKENQAVAQLVLIVVSYLIGYIPTTGEPMDEKIHYSLLYVSFYEIPQI